VAFDATATTQHVGPGRLRLTRATRDLLDAVLGADTADDAALDRAAATLEDLAADLLGQTGRSAHQPIPQGPRARYGDYLPRSVLVGQVHPVSPGAAWSYRDGVLEVRTVLGPLYEGPPGSVHGGFVALAFDELLGMATVLGGHPGLTGRLTVRYRARTPLHTELRLTAWVEHHEGRRTVARGEIHAGELLTAEVEGLFVGVQPGTADPVPRD